MGSTTVKYQTIKNNYDLLPRTDGLLESLDRKITTYNNAQVYTKSTDQATITSDLNLIVTQYYTPLKQIKSDLQELIQDSTQAVAESSNTLESAERYSQRHRPQDTALPREFLWGIIPAMKKDSVPYILGAGIFMSLVSLFLILNAVGFHIVPPVILPPTAIGAIPFYKNPMYLGIGVVVLLVIAAVFIGLYFTRN